MLKDRKIDRLCLVVLALALALTLLFMNGEALGLQKASAAPDYITRLFDQDQVHQVDIVAEDWETILADPQAEVYIPCTVLIDGERFDNIGLRAKGNNSLRLSEKYGHDRFSLKLEFDHYIQSSYYGLDKLSLDASFQDNSYLKTWIAFDMMSFQSVPTPLCSYTWVTVNGADWGLFLAIEEPEEAFCRRNFGENYGRLYKPDYRSLSDENADVALKYIDDDPESYPGIFDNAKFKTSQADRERVIEALKILDSGERLEEAIDTDEVLRYFTVQSFVINLDSYLGKNGHNYYLYEEDGILSILPWDYNLAFGTYSLGMPDPINDAELYINYPINTPASGQVMLNRPLYHHLMKYGDSLHQYHAHYDRLISDYFESGLFEERVATVASMIAPYVERDPTAYCSWEDHQLAVETITRFCLLRAESVRGQLDGTIPATIRGQQEDSSQLVDASSIWLPDLGEVEDLKD